VGNEALKIKEQLSTLASEHEASVQTLKRNLEGVHSQLDGVRRALDAVAEMNT